MAKSAKLFLILAMPLILGYALVLENETWGAQVRGGSTFGNNAANMETLQINTWQTSFARLASLDSLRSSEVSRAKRVERSESSEASLPCVYLLILLFCSIIPRCRPSWDLGPQVFVL